jgi:hypothetical protein
MHPTVKPVVLVPDAILDCSRKAIVLDVFAGSGTTLVAAQRTGRRCRVPSPIPTRPAARKQDYAAAAQSP